MLLILIKIDIPADVVRRAIANTDIRKSWDKLFDHFEVVEEDEEAQYAVLYYTIKAPWGVKNRDFLQSRKIIDDWPK